MILFVYGPDTFRVQEKTKELIDQFRAKRDTVGMNVVKLAGETLSFDRLRQEVMTQGFLSEKKMIVIDRLLSRGNADVHQEVLEFIKQFTKSKDEQNVILFIEEHVGGKLKDVTKKLFTALKKQEYVFEFTELNPNQLEEWTRGYVKRFGATFDRMAPRELVARVGADLWKLSQEIHKLASFKRDVPITQSDVTAQVDGGFEENIFALTDAIASQNKSRALQLLSQELDNGANELYLLSMISRQFRILLQLRSNIDTGNTVAKKLASELGLHPYVVQKSLPLAKRYTLDQLKRIYTQILELDEAFKTSHPNPELLLDLLIVEAGDT